MAPMKTRLPAVVMAPPELGVPVWMPFAVELLELAERHAPGDVAGVRVDGDEFAPRRRGAAPPLRGIPEASAFGRDLRHGGGALGLLPRPRPALHFRRPSPPPPRPPPA